jgi:hypothetical protein
MMISHLSKISCSALQTQVYIFMYALIFLHRNHYGKTSILKSIPRNTCICVYLRTFLYDDNDDITPFQDTVVRNPNTGTSVGSHLSLSLSLERYIYMHIFTYIYRHIYKYEYMNIYKFT